MHLHTSFWSDVAAVWAQVSGSLVTCWVTADSSCCFENSHIKVLVSSGVGQDVALNTAFTTIISIDSVCQCSILVRPSHLAACPISHIVSYQLKTWTKPPSQKEEDPTAACERKREGMQ